MAEETADETASVAKFKANRAIPAVTERPDSTQDAERSLLRIRELTSQRNELRRQIEEQRKQASPLNHAGIAAALDEFYSFFLGYTNYFWNLAPHELGNLDSTYESVLNRALTNMRELWDQLSMAINQRYNPVFRDKLAAADARASRLMERTRAAGIVHGLPILYYNKLFKISRHPYQTHPLLGISPDIHDQEDGASLFVEDASLAHELGHHVFWNNGELAQYAARLDELDGAIAGVVLARFPFNRDARASTARLSDIRGQFLRYNLWLEWVEETFADVFGTLLIGPRFAKSAQDILIREGLGRPSDLIVSDAEHPVPALRPLIALETLRIIAAASADAPFKEQLSTLTATLDARWDTIWQEALAEEQRGRTAAPIAFGAQHHGDGEPIAPKLDDLKALVPQIVKLILTTLQFATKGDDAQPTGTLLSALDYWGKTPQDEYKNEIEQLSSELRSDQLSTLTARFTATGRADALPFAAGEEGKLFDKFREFVEDMVRQDPGAFGRSEKVWQIILGFDLTLDHGAKPGCHTHSLASGTVSC